MMAAMAMTANFQGLKFRVGSSSRWTKFRVSSFNRVGDNMYSTDTCYRLRHAARHVAKSQADHILNRHSHSTAWNGIIVSPLGCSPLVHVPRQCTANLCLKLGLQTLGR
jgi:hypothetical protein